MLSKDFYGKQGFVWFTGLVAQVGDKSKLGLVRVRIVGIHSLDESLCPTETLPWAQVLLPPTGAHTTSGPIPGDWVFGFFQDGDFGQIPTITGVFPGIESPQSRAVYKKVAEIEKSRSTQQSSSNTSQSTSTVPDWEPAFDYRTDGADTYPEIKQHEVDTFGYYPRTSQIFRELEDATSFRSARGVIDGTLTLINNERLAEACDISEEVKTALAWARLENNVIIKALTTALKAAVLAIAGTDFSGLISQVIYFVKLITRWINWIRAILKYISDWIQVINYVIRKIKAIIAFIMSLPERFLQFLRKCLSYFLSGIARFINGIISSTLIDFDLDGLADALMDLDNSIRGIIDYTDLIRGGIDDTINEITDVPTQSGETALLPADVMYDILNPTTMDNRANATISLITFTQIKNSEMEARLNIDMYYNKTRNYDDIQYLIKWTTP